MRRTVFLLLSSVLIAATAHADAVNDYAGWKKLSPGERAYYAGGFVDGHLVGDGSPERAAYYIGVTTCLAKKGLTPAKLAEAITGYYEKNAAERSKPPGVAILKSIMRGTCLDTINAERRKQKLPPLTKSDG